MPTLSIILPIYNEEGNIGPLFERLLPVLDGLGQPYEVIAVNDGSSDGTSGKLAAVAEAHPQVRVVEFVRNLGQTAAMQAGFDHSSGEVIIPLDADLQNDPADIPRLLTCLEDGCDVASGWRKDRKDAGSRVLPSKVANALISRLSGVRLHDYGCSLKAYRREVINNVRLYGEMHRFIPIYAAWEGARVAEVPVTHHPRRSGSSKYGFNRIFKVLLDLCVICFMNRYMVKPIYVFGGVGLFFWLVGGLAFLWALCLKLFAATTFVQTPLPLVSAGMFGLGVLAVLMGLLAEIATRTYFESQGRPSYRVRRRWNFSRDAAARPVPQGMTGGRAQGPDHGDSDEASGNTSARRFGDA